MSWLVLVAIAVIFDSLRIFIDNYVSDVYFKGRGSASQKLFYGYFFIAAAVILFLIFGIDFEHTTFANLAWIFVAGILSTVAGIPYYRALEYEDSTTLSIFIQLAPVLYLVLGWLFLGEQFEPAQLIAFAVILAGPMVIIFSGRKNGRQATMGAVVMAAIYILISVTGNLIFVKNNSCDLIFTTPMMVLFLGKGLSNLAIMYGVPKYRRRFLTVLKKNRKKLLRTLCVDGVVSLIKDFAYRGTLILAPTVAIASAVSDSVEPIVIFVMGIILTLIWPKFGREKLTKKAVLTHLIATVLVVTGIVILQVI